MSARLASRRALVRCRLHSPEAEVAGKKVWPRVFQSGARLVCAERMSDEGLERESTAAQICAPGRPGLSAPMADCRDVHSPSASSEA